jgi:hypothetical protein
MKEPGLKELDAPLCISVDARKNIEGLREAALKSVVNNLGRKLEMLRVYG